MVELTIFLAFHPHAASTLIECHVHCAIEEEGVLLGGDVLVDFDIGLSQLNGLLIVLFWFGDGKFFIVIF